MSEQFKHLYDTYLVKPANSILHNPLRLHLIENGLFNNIITNKTPVDVQDEFLDFYPKWIASSKLNSFTGLESLPYRYVSLGVTQGIDDFVLYCLKNNKRIRTCRGEYGYGIEISPYHPQYEDTELLPGDALIISCPFSATGDKHEQWDIIISTCNTLDIPVFVDCAFFGTCLDITVDFNQPCINTVSFSPTKGLNCGNMRTGITFSKRQGRDCSLDILSKWHHGIHMHTYFAYNLMTAFGPDTIPNSYRQVQLDVCKHYGLMPTNSIHLATGGEEWSYFDRGNGINRICLRNPIFDMANKGIVQ